MTPMMPFQRQYAVSRLLAESDIALFVRIRFGNQASGIRQNLDTSRTRVAAHQSP